jgi:hypothetical protein
MHTIFSVPIRPCRPSKPLTAFDRYKQSSRTRSNSMWQHQQRVQTGRHAETQKKQGHAGPRIPRRQLIYTTAVAVAVQKRSAFAVKGKPSSNPERQHSNDDHLCRARYNLQACKPVTAPTAVAVAVGIPRCSRAAVFFAESAGRKLSVVVACLGP